MIKIIISSILLVGLLATPAFADSPLLPVLDDDYQPQIGLSALVGVQQFEEETGLTFGAEFAFNCLLLDSVRTQLSATYFRDEHDNFSIITTELSPHYTFDLSPTLFVGIGPVLGASFLVTENETYTVFNYGAGASFRYVNPSGFFAGFDARYAFTTDVEVEAGPFSLSLFDLDNARYLGKIGYQF